MASELIVLPNHVPVKCRLKFSIGITWEYPPPAAPPNDDS